MKQTPPKWADKFLQWYCRADLLEEIQGDAYELFYRTAKESKRKADLFFVWNVIRFFKIENINKSMSNIISTHMITNYYKVFSRNFLKQRAYSMLNLLGLAMGICCFLLISFYVYDELSYDRFNSKVDRIFRVHEILENEGVGERSASLPFPVAAALQNDYPGVVTKSVRLFNFQSPSLAIATIDHNKEYNETKFFFADSTFLDVFDFRLVEGDRQKALHAPETVLLTERTARKYFGSTPAVGQYLVLQGGTNLLVTGIIEDVPIQSHLQFDFIASFSTLHRFYDGRLPESWYWNPCWTYVVLDDPRSAPSVEATLPSFVKKYFPEFVRNDITLQLFPLADIHLKSNMDYEMQPNGQNSVVYIFLAIGIFILLIASINFINLSTARAVRRAKEVGIRKTLGSKKTQLMQQFLLESLLYSVYATVVAVVLVIIVMPYFNALAEKSFSYRIFLNPSVMLGLIVFCFTIGIIAGSYPSLVLSSFPALSALKANLKSGRGAVLRKSLVVVQFSISMILIIGTGVATDQIKFLQKQDTGFEQESILMVPVSRTPIKQHYESFKAEVTRNPNILKVTAIEEILGAKHQTGNYSFEGFERSKPFPRLNVRHDFLQTFDIPIVAGRDYSEDYPTDDSLALVVNEQFVKQMNWSNEEAIGKSFGNAPNKSIIGVAKDFNFVSKHNPIRPLVLDLDLNPDSFDLFIKYMAIRINSKNTPEAITWLEEKWKSYMPGWPFEYFFLKNSLSNLYKAEAKLSKVTLLFSSLAIMIACLGLFGLAAYSAEQRKKEMSVRKVLGSTNASIFVLFTREFLTLILISFTIACPLTYLLLNHWLSGFAYHTKINVVLFALAGAFVSLVTLITIAYQAYRTAVTNPATVLKNE